jgi:hypothetical protein
MVARLLGSLSGRMLSYTKSLCVSYMPDKTIHKRVGPFPRYRNRKPNY